MPGTVIYENERCGDSVKFEFEKFVEVDSSFSAKVTVRQKTGQIGFNSGAINRFKIDNFSYSILYFDPTYRVVGIQLVDAEQPGAIKISKKSSNTYITAKNFLDKYGINYENSHRHDLERDTDSGFLYFHVDEDAESEASERVDSGGNQEDIQKGAANLLDDV